MIASAGLLAYALATRRADIATIGAIVYVLGALIDLHVTTRLAREYRAGAEDVWTRSKPHGLIHRITSVLNAAILFGAIIAMLVGGDDNHHPGAFRAGSIIWIGGILAYFITGIIIREVAGIPLRMGYGGWDIAHPRRRRTR